MTLSDEELKNIIDEFTENGLENLEVLAQPRAEITIPPWVRDCPQLTPPFTWFGGKRKVAKEVWDRFGWDIPNYIEPFAGGLAVLLARPVYDLAKFKSFVETFNDKNLLLLNFWRAVQFGDINELIKNAVFPSHETEILARRRFMLKNLPRLEQLLNEEKPTSYDIELAGFWLYVTRNWIGVGADDSTLYCKEKIPRKRIGRWIGGSSSVHLRCLQSRLKNAAGFVGHWQRATESRTQTTSFPITGVFLDPPYRGSEDFYAGVTEEMPQREVIADVVDTWALERGGNEKFRLAVCGYEHNFSSEYEKQKWNLFRWKPSIGMKSGTEVQLRKEVVEITAFSPHCLPGKQKTVKPAVV